MTRAKKARIKRTSRGGGRHVSPEVTSAMEARGYISPAEARKLVGVRGGTVYGWITRGVLRAPDGDEREPIVRAASGSNVWVLRDAVLAMRPQLKDPA